MSHLCPCNKARRCSGRSWSPLPPAICGRRRVCVSVWVSTLLLPHLSSVLSSPPPSLSPLFSYVLFSPLVFFLLGSITTERRLGCYLHKTTTKGAGLTFLYGPGSKPLTNGADIRGNELLMLYCNFTAGTRYLHGGSK